MPTFDFTCETCQARFEQKLAFGSKELPLCPQCASKNVRKLISPPMVHFKGAGFYKTDSRSSHVKSKTKPAETKTDAPAKTDTPAKVPDAPTSASGGTKKADVPK